MVSRLLRQVNRASALALVALGLTGCQSNPNSASDVPFLTVTELRIGTGAQAVNGDLLTVNYLAWLFDSGESDNKGEQVDSGSGLTFVLGANQVLPAFDQGLVGMRVGGERRLNVPPRLALGGTGSGNIPANAALVMEVELVDAQPLITDTAPFTIIDLQVGTGAGAVDGDILTVGYGGWLYDESQPDGKGLFFEASPSTGLSFPLGQGRVIPGWDQGLVGMRVGGERRLIIPPELAYGANGPGLIPPNATLLFDIMLAGIQ